MHRLLQLTLAIVLLPLLAYSQPAITSFSPISAKPGDGVTLTGSNFNSTAANNVVFFGAARAIVKAATATSIIVTVPSGATFAPITLLNTGTALVTYSLSNFTPTFNPAKTTIGSTDFVGKQDFATGSSPFAVAIGDLDGDGKADLAVANFNSNTVSVYRNTSSNGSIGSTSFTTKIDFITGINPYSVAIDDLDGDGKLDLVVANSSSGTVSVFRNTSTSGGISTASFANKVDFITGTASRSVAIGDLDGDGKPDLAIANLGSDTVSVLRNTSTIGSIVTGSFAAKVDFTTGTTPYSVTIGDLDGDGKPDLALANIGDNTFSVYRNTTTRGNIAADSFAPRVNFITDPRPIAIAIGDLDRDGKPDLALVGQGSGSVSVFRNTFTSGSISTSSFAPKFNFTVGSGNRSVAIGDLDGDAKPDLVVTNSTSATVSVLRNTANSGIIRSDSFANRIDFITGAQPVAIAIADLDGDGKSDLAVTNLTSNTVSVLRNADYNTDLSALTIGAGTLAPSFASATTAYTASVNNGIISITVTPTVVDATATVQVRVNNGTYATVTTANASAALLLNVGSNTIDVVVTAQNASAKTYTITVCRMALPTFSAIPIVCSGNSFALPSTSNNGITGTWSPAINTMATTIYTFTPNTNQCAATTTLTATIGAVTTWSANVWDNGTPTSTMTAIITDNYILATDLTACSLAVTGTAIVNVPSGFNVTVSGKVTVASTARLTFQNNSNLIQTGTMNNNSGNITVKRNSNALMLSDYTMWSSPVAGQQLKDFSRATLDNRFYTYNPVNDKYSAIAPAANFSTATGYLIRMPNNHPTAPTVWNGSFTGVPNNGTITLNSLASNKFYAIGNPYPSTISADAFLNGNATNGTLYFWRKTNAASGTAYATYTLAGSTGTAAGKGGLGNPNGTIQVGQGFIVETGATATALNFTNAMRTANNANQIFKTKKADDKSRIWLNLTNTKGAFSQAMIAYFEGATLGLDAGIDGKYIDDSKIALTSTIDAAEYTIQGRPAFDASDVVALSFKTDVAGAYTIAIDAIDGLFTAGQEVYLVDSLTGKETNLKAGGYTFAATVGEAKDRFSLKYQKTLKVGAPAFNESTVTVFRNNGVLTVNSASKAIKTIQVYDVQGRLLAQQMNVNATKASFNNLKTATQVLVVKVIADDNTAVSKKVLN